MQEPSCPAASTPRGAWGALVPSASPPGVRGLRDSSGTSRWQARWAQALWVQAPCLSLTTLFEVVSRACPRSTDRRTKVRSGTTQATCSGVRTCTRSAALGPGTEPLLPAPVQQEGEEPSVGTGSLGLWGHSDRVAFRDIEARASVQQASHRAERTRGVRPVTRGHGRGHPAGVVLPRKQHELPGAGRGLRGLGRLLGVPLMAPERGF